MRKAGNVVIIPDFLPGKRALAIGLCVYHSIISTVIFQAPRFIPFSFGPTFEASVLLLLSCTQQPS